DDPRATLVLDLSLLGHPVLYCGSGLPEVSVELAAADLAGLRADVVLADLCSEAA
ncbi:MAG: hypothetical protein HZB48_07315, partial [Actinobacteria bacterium]|nr:hypothetical protein [Actinomycetota bacterium]